MMDKDNLYTFDKGTVSSRLIKWGQWKMRSGVALGYPSAAAFVGLNPSSPSEWCGQAIDSECVQTNQAVEALPYVLLIVVRVEYISGYKDSAVKAHACGISKRSYYNYLDHAREIVANNLNLNLHMVHKNDINLLSCLEVRSA
ncbi:hypothetical protein [Nitrosomonas ureae]|nr:hypothetical protein [Nitrosomonas ureae]